jgi:hypothetical protein
MVLKEGHRAVGPPIFACTKGTDTHTHTHTHTHSSSYSSLKTCDPKPVLA